MPFHQYGNSDYKDKTVVLWSLQWKSLNSLYLEGQSCTETGSLSSWDPICIRTAMKRWLLVAAVICKWNDWARQESNSVRPAGPAGLRFPPLVSHPTSRQEIWLPIIALLLEMHSFRRKLFQILDFIEVCSDSDGVMGLNQGLMLNKHPAFDKNRDNKTPKIHQVYSSIVCQRHAF